MAFGMDRKHGIILANIFSIVATFTLHDPTKNQNKKEPKFRLNKKYLFRASGRVRFVF